MLDYIDPCIELSSETGFDNSKEFEKWYIETYGMPGTPEFEAKLKEINEQYNK